MTIKEFQRAIKKAREELKKELQAFHRNAAEIARYERIQGFEKGVSPTGEKWDKLKPATIRSKSGDHATTRVYRKTKGGPSGLSKRKAKASKSPKKPLIDTGALMTPTIRATAGYGKVIMARSRGEMVSSAGSIGKIHNEGAGKVPRREHWGIYPEAINRINKAWYAKVEQLRRMLSNG